MGSGRSIVAAQTRSSGAKSDPIVLSSPSKSPPTRRKTREKNAEKVRVDSISGRVQKLSAAPKKSVLTTGAQILVAASAAVQKIVREPPKAVLTSPLRNGHRFHRRSPSPADQGQEVPFTLQMSLFSTTQKLIEETLFYWTKKWAPEVLARKKWNQPEQTELNYWFRSFDDKRYLRDIVVQAIAQSHFSLSYEELRVLLASLQHIRHAAVHRKAYRISYIRELMADATRITRCMNDPSRNKKIREMQNALLKDDLQALVAVISRPLLDFDDPIASGSVSPSKEDPGHEVGQHAEWQHKILAAGQSVSDEGVRKEDAECLPASLVAISGKENRVEQNGSVQARAMPHGVKSLQRGFGTRLENATYAAETSPRRTRSSTKNAIRRKFIDLTEDVDDDILMNLREHQPNLEGKGRQSFLNSSNEKAQVYLGRTFIEISDTDTESENESGDIDAGVEGDDDDDDVDDDNTVHFSNAGRMGPIAQSRRPIMGKDF